MSVVRFTEWQKLCEDAFGECDPEKLLQRVIVAETAIFRRLRGLRSRPENIELEAMVSMLIELRRVVARTSKASGGEEKAAKKLLRNPSDGSKQNAGKRRAQPFA
jgi:hypothetical protein